jgi:hypothetical protein
MKLGEPILKILAKTYEPLTLINQSFKGYDIAFKTDEDGNPILLFIGHMNEKGIIKGDRYARTLKKDRDGKIIKDHWERKGKAS